VKEIKCLKCGEPAAFPALFIEKGGASYTCVQCSSEIQKESRGMKSAEEWVPDPVRSHFCACPNCEPVMCCNGMECNCMGLPVDFKPTDKCDGYCLNKTHRELQTARSTIDQQTNKIQELEKAYETTKQHMHAYATLFQYCQDEFDTYADGAPDATSLGKFCNRMIGELNERLTAHAVPPDDLTTRKLDMAIEALEVVEGWCMPAREALKQISELK
jgi:hypothetical protein